MVWFLNGIKNQTKVWFCDSRPFFYRTRKCLVIRRIQILGVLDSDPLFINLVVKNTKITWIKVCWNCPRSSPAAVNSGFGTAAAAPRRWSNCCCRCKACSFRWSCCCCCCKICCCCIICAWIGCCCWWCICCWDVGCSSCCWCCNSCCKSCCCCCVWSPWKNCVTSEGCDDSWTWSDAMTGGKTIGFGSRNFPRNPAIYKKKVRDLF